MIPGKKNLLALLRTHSYQKRRVTLKSGRESDFYIDCRKTVLSAQGHRLAGHVIHTIIRQHLGIAHLFVGGVCVGANPLVSAVSTLSAEKLGGQVHDGFYIRKAAKTHGTQQRIEAPWSMKPGDHAVILEDVVTTGGSTIDAIKAAQDWGLVVDLIIALVDREEDNGALNIAKHAPFVSVFKRSDFEEEV